MATLASSSPYIILHRFVLRRPTVQFASLITQSKQCLCIPLKTTPFLSPPPFSTRSFFTTSPRAISEQLGLLENAQIESDNETRSVSAPDEGLKRSNLGGIKTPPPPSLTVKEKKDLASYAHSLGKKLKSQQVGKSGVTDLVITALIETLEANELLKIKIHSNCPDELEDAVKRLEDGTGSVVVGQIGRTVILYRPSVTKLKAEEKKKQAQIAYLKKQSKFKQFSQNKRPVPVPGEETIYGRGRRGSSRY